MAPRPQAPHALGRDQRHAHGSGGQLDAPPAMLNLMVGSDQPVKGAHDSSAA